MKPRGPPWRRALFAAAAIAAVTLPLHLSGFGMRLLLVVAGLVGLIAWALPWIGVRLLDDAVLWARARLWAAEQGRFHSFGGVPLRIEDDGRHVWVDGAGVQRLLRRAEPEEALAARHAGHWRRDADGVLLLRVDAVVRHLATMPGRTDPRVQRLRRYFEREVLYPAATRRRGRG